MSIMVIHFNNRPCWNLGVAVRKFHVQYFYLYPLGASMCNKNVLEVGLARADLTDVNMRSRNFLQLWLARDN